MMMYAVRIFLACAVLIVTCRPEQDFVYKEEITVEKILRSYTQKHHSSTSQRRLQKSGHAKNCGAAGSHLNITWTPETIIIGQDATIYVNMTTATSLSVAKASIAVFVGSSTEGQPMFELSDSRSCSELEKYVRILKCPIKKGISFAYSFTRQMGQLPDGVYSARIKINNENNEMFACVELTVTLRSPDN